MLSVWVVELRTPTKPDILHNIFENLHIQVYVITLPPFVSSDGYIRTSITWTKTTSPCIVFYISLFLFNQKANFLHLPALSPHPPTRYTLSDHCLECAGEHTAMSQLLQILVSLSVSQQQPPNSPFIWRHTHQHICKLYTQYNKVCTVTCFMWPAERIHVWFLLIKSNMIRWSESDHLSFSFWLTRHYHLWNIMKLEIWYLRNTTTCTLQVTFWSHHHREEEAAGLDTFSWLSFHQTRKISNPPQLFFWVESIFQCFKVNVSFVTFSHIIFVITTSSHYR